MPANLLRNPGFEAGANPFDPQGIVYIPKEWTFAFREGDRDRLPRQAIAWGRPNAGCLSPAQFPPHEHPLFFQDGSQVLWKVWSGRSYPFYITLSQAVTLSPGGRYRLTVRVHPDMVTQYAPQGKVYSTDPDIGAVRLFARGGGQAIVANFVKVGPAMPNGQYTTLTLEFDAPVKQVEVGLEAYGLFSIENCCFFFDNFALEQSEAPLPEFAAPANNLLVNGSFEEGKAYIADETHGLAVPAGWLLEVRDGQPLAELLEKRQTSPGDQARFFAIGDYCWRVASPAPFDVRLWQGVSGLAVGQTYRASALVFPDFASAPESVEAALTARFEDQSFGTGWLNGTALPIRRYNRLELTFQAVGRSVHLSLELRTRGAVAGAWVVDLVALEALP